MNFTSIWAYISAHPKTATAVIFYIWSAAIGALPSPDIHSGKFYQFLFAFLNTLGANISRAFSPRLPVAVAQAQGVSVAQDRDDRGLPPAVPGAPGKPPAPPAPHGIFRP
jgi:hypothetical protein